MSLTAGVSPRRPAPAPWPVPSDDRPRAGQIQAEVSESAALDVLIPLPRARNAKGSAVAAIVGDAFAHPLGGPLHRGFRHLQSCHFRQHALGRLGETIT